MFFEVDGKEMFQPGLNFNSFTTCDDEKELKTGALAIRFLISARLCWLITEKLCFSSVQGV